MGIGVWYKKSLSTSFTTFIIKNQSGCLYAVYSPIYLLKNTDILIVEKGHWGEEGRGGQQRCEGIGRESWEEGQWGWGDRQTLEGRGTKRRGGRGRETEGRGRVWHARGHTRHGRSPCHPHPYPCPCHDKEEEERIARKVSAWLEEIDDFIGCQCSKELGHDKDTSEHDKDSFAFPFSWFEWYWSQFVFDQYKYKIINLVNFMYIMCNREIWVMWMRVLKLVHGGWKSLVGKLIILRIGYNWKW